MARSSHLIGCRDCLTPGLQLVLKEVLNPDTHRVDLHCVSCDSRVWPVTGTEYFCVTCDDWVTQN